MTRTVRQERAANRALISEFELGRAPGDFHHADHMRVAFAYVAEFPLLEAISGFSHALKRFALSKGKPHLYHETITWAYLFLIHERIERAGFIQCWEEFSGHNADLLVWKPGILERYYAPTTLDSDLARGTFVFPDRAVLQPSLPAAMSTEGSGVSSSANGSARGNTVRRRR